MIARRALPRFRGVHRWMATAFLALAISTGLLLMHSVGVGHHDALGTVSVSSAANHTPSAHTLLAGHADGTELSENEHVMQALCVLAMVFFALAFNIPRTYWLRPPARAPNPLRLLQRGAPPFRPPRPESLCVWRI